MCGIISAVSKKNIIPEISSGLKCLEYRGYDSAGIASINNREIFCVKSAGKVSELEKQLNSQNLLHSNIAIGHTRWATHGSPTVENAHPHYTENVAIVHNGVIENYQEIKDKLKSNGYVFNSDTDSEVIAKLLDYYLQQNNDFANASNKTVNHLKGSYSVAFIARDKPDCLFAAKNRTSLIIGIGNEGMYVVSDIVALNNSVENIIYLDDEDRAIITANSYKIFDKNKKEMQRPSTKSIKTDKASKGNYPNFMIKEINEQPFLFKRLLENYLDGSRFQQIDIDWNKMDKIRILACGTAYIAGLVAKYWLEELANISVDVEIASEYRYRKTPNTEKSVTIIISQSGETLDTFEAMKVAKVRGHKTIAVVNVEQSLIAREADYVMPIIAGVEIGVASSKAFLNQIAVLSTLALDIAETRKQITAIQKNKYHAILKNVPDKIEKVIQDSNKLQQIAKEMTSYSSALFIGRNLLYPIALEGALKLKELSYIHAEGYAGGELKHGPISLIDENMPLIALVPSGNLFEKIYSNVQEIVARNAQTLCITDKNSAPKLKSYARWIFEVPACDNFILPMIYTIPMQLLAYYVASEKGNNIDQPRNLAKSVTVE